MLSFKILNKNPFQVDVAKPSLFGTVHEIWERRLDGTWYHPGHYSEVTETLKEQLERIFKGASQL